MIEVIADKAALAMVAGPIQKSEAVVIGWHAVQQFQRYRARCDRIGIEPDYSTLDHVERHQANSEYLLAKAVGVLTKVVERVPLVTLGCLVIFVTLVELGGQLVAV